MSPNLKTEDDFRKYLGTGGKINAGKQYFLLFHQCFLLSCRHKSSFNPLPDDKF